jgi:hypothetical protein
MKNRTHFTRENQMMKLSPSKHYILLYRDKEGEIKSRKLLGKRLPPHIMIRELNNQLPHGFKIVEMKYHRTNETRGRWWWIKDRISKWFRTFQT